MPCSGIEGRICPLTPGGYQMRINKSMHLSFIPKIPWTTIGLDFTTTFLKTQQDILTQSSSPKVSELQKKKKNLRS